MDNKNQIKQQVTDKIRPINISKLFEMFFVEDIMKIKEPIIKDDGLIEFKGHEFQIIKNKITNEKPIENKYDRKSEKKQESTEDY